MQENAGVDGEFQALSAQELLTQDVEELKRTVAERKEEADRERERGGRVRCLFRLPPCC
jgi:hypothetical protein